MKPSGPLGYSPGIGTTSSNTRNPIPVPANYQSGATIESIIEGIIERLEKLETQMKNDKRIHDENEFVRDLYEQYQVALKLAKNEEDLENEDI